jgi:hypothetical protein
MNGVNGCLCGIRVLLPLVFWLTSTGVAGTIDQVLADKLSQTPANE